MQDSTLVQHPYFLFQCRFLTDNSSIMGSPGSSSSTNCLPATCNRSTPNYTRMSDSGYLSATPADSPLCSSKESPCGCRKLLDYPEPVKLDKVVATTYTVASKNLSISKKKHCWNHQNLVPLKEKGDEKYFSVLISRELHMLDENDTEDQRKVPMEECTNDATSHRDRILGQKIDFIKEFRYQKNIPHIVHKIFLYLHPKDLCAVVCVSHAWREACLEDHVANQKRLRFLEHFRRSKENRCTQIYPRVPKSYASPSSILGQLPINKTPVNVPYKIEHDELRNYDELKTPETKSRFKEFAKEAASLEDGGELRHCPHCRSPSRVNKIKDEAICQRPSCSFNFCILCKQTCHPAQPCRAYTLEDNVPLEKTPGVGSKRSKRNLRRL